jgi:hypothetical protein
MGMDVSSGDIRYFQMDKDGKIYPEHDVRVHEMELGKLPDSDCNKCNGKGYNGRDVDTGWVVPCPCTDPQPKSFIQSMRKRIPKQTMDEFIKKMHGYNEEDYNYGRK